jgi:hypothetical protein
MGMTEEVVEEVEKVEKVKKVEIVEGPNMLPGDSSPG